MRYLGSTISLLLLTTLSSYAQWTLSGYHRRPYSMSVTGDTVFVATGDYIDRSANNFQSWTNLSNGVDIYTLSVLADGRHVLAGAFTGVYVSTNGGDAWTAGNSTLWEHIVTLAETPSYFFAGVVTSFSVTPYRGVYRSSDNGYTWAAANNGLDTAALPGYSIYPGLQINSLATAGQTLYACTETGLYASTDEGASWSVVGSGLPQGVNSTAVASGGGYVYAAFTQQGIFRAPLNGGSWTPINQGLPNSTYVNVLFFHNDCLFAGRGFYGGIYRSSDNGTTWKDVNYGLGNGDPRTILSMVTEGSTALIGTDGALFTRPFGELTSPSVSFGGTVIQFGNVRLGTSRDTIIAITNNGSETLQVTNVAVTGSKFSMHGPTSAVLATGESISDTIHFDASTLGFATGSLVVSSNSYNTLDTLKLSGTAVIPQLRLNMNFIQYGRVNIGDSVAQQISFLNSGTDTLRISNVLPTDSNFTTSILNAIIPPGGRLNWIATFTPHMRGVRVGEIIIASNSPEALDTIIVGGTGILVHIRFNTSRVDFNPIGRGEHRWLPFAIHNDGLDTLTISGMTSSDADFTVNPSTLAVAPEDSGKLTITFNSKTPGYRTGILSLSDNAIGSPHQITLIGLYYSGNTVLEQNFPNPVNILTFIQFSLTQSGYTSLKLYDILGKEVATWIDGDMSAGPHQGLFGRTGLADGVYFYRLVTRDGTETRKMVLLNGWLH